MNTVSIDWDILKKPEDYVYLSTGDLCGFYTLHYVQWLPVFNPSHEIIGYECVDSYVKNLAIDGGDAEARAADWAEKRGCECYAEADFGLLEHNRYVKENEIALGFAMKRQEMLFGKLKGSSFSEALASDPRYLQWVCDQGSEMDSPEVFQSRHLSPFKLTCLAVYRLVSAGEIVIPEKAPEPEGLPSAHIGTIGERVELDGVVKFIKGIDSQFGTSFLIIVEVNGKDIVKMFTTSNIIFVERDDRIRFKATIDKHSEYEGKLETMVKRPKLVWDFDQPEDDCDTANAGLKQPKKPFQEAA